MNENIATQNAKRLASLSAIFCLINGIPATPELAPILSGAVMANIGKWYEEHGRTDFNPQTELICEDAIKFAFERVQTIANLALISAQTGIGMEGLGGMVN